MEELSRFLPSSSCSLFLNYISLQESILLPSTSTLSSSQPSQQPPPPCPPAPRKPPPLLSLTPTTSEPSLPSLTTRTPTSEQTSKKTRTTSQPTTQRNLPPLLPLPQTRPRWKETTLLWRLPRRLSHRESPEAMDGRREGRKGTRSLTFSP
ncbi:hypothetical protein BDY24DRAFT_76522 [Mrakia frigida]|uniref:uncharacterized protein n=1 Tax=Mrakia frigida TaxID=29902 RepID=UPI003FCBF202